MSCVRSPKRNNRLEEWLVKFRTACHGDRLICGTAPIRLSANVRNSFAPKCGGSYSKFPAVRFVSRISVVLKHRQGRVSGLGYPKNRAKNKTQYCLQDRRFYTQAAFRKSNSAIKQRNLLCRNTGECRFFRSHANDSVHTYTLPEKWALP